MNFCFWITWFHVCVDILHGFCLSFLFCLSVYLLSFSTGFINVAVFALFRYLKKAKINKGIYRSSVITKRVSVKTRLKYLPIFTQNTTLSNTWYSSVFYVTNVYHRQSYLWICPNFMNLLIGGGKISEIWSV